MHWYRIGLVVIFFVVFVLSLTVAWGADWDYKKTNWTELTEKALDQHGQYLLNGEAPKDAKKYCIGSDRKKSYVNLIASMARFESGHNPMAKYQENFRDRNGKYVVSRGLLQLSKESANSSRYKCNITQEVQLHDPKTNLECTVKILNYWVSQDKVVGSQKRGGARYWSVLRETHQANKKIINKVCQ